MLINKQQTVLLGLFDELNIDLEDYKSHVNVNPLYDPINTQSFWYLKQNGMGLRRKQVEKLEDIIKELDSDSPTENIHQMIMGFGKTKVLLPILAQRLADANHLSMVIVPDELLDDVVGDLNKKSANIFGQKPFLFKFDRNTSLNDGDLDMLEQQLKESISAKTLLYQPVEHAPVYVTEELANINHLNAQLKEHSVDNLPDDLLPSIRPAIQS